MVNDDEAIKRAILEYNLFLDFKEVNPIVAMRRAINVYLEMTQEKDKSNG